MDYAENADCYSLRITEFKQGMWPPSWSLHFPDSFAAVSAM